MGNINKQKTHPRHILAAQRRARAIELRVQGKSTPQIAKELGCHWKTAQNIIRKALANLSEEEQEKATHLRGLTMRRLEALFRANWEKAQAGDEKAFERVMGIMKEELRLYGLSQGPSVQLNQLNVVNLPPEELARRARMVGLEVDLPQLDHDPNVIDVEVMNGSTGRQTPEDLYTEVSHPEGEDNPGGASGG